MKFLIVGLGNVGIEYQNTRHNIGFDILDAWISNKDVNFSNEKLAFYTQFNLKGHQIHLIKPTTYMNLSGKALNYWMQKLNIPIEQVLVLADDLNLPLGTIRIKSSGSAGGHNGFKHIIETLQSDVFSRLRFGIGQQFSKSHQVDFVLGKWKPDEVNIVNNTIISAILAIECFVNEGLAKAMNQFNKNINM